MVGSNFVLPWPMAKRKEDAPPLPLPMLAGRYATVSFAVALLLLPPAILTDTTRSVNASDAWFSAAVTGTLTALVDRAAAATNATRKYFATGVMDFDPKLYGLAQCAPDLTPAQCRGCLRNLQNVVVSARFLSGRPPSNSAFVVWCSVRYSVTPIYDGRAMLQLAAPPEPPSATLTPPSSGLNSEAPARRSRTLN
ncbi:uncharacterized protein C2845_PM03G09240 [Panicum miliaceum]|uniref:Gnk2-homologous domain-containing protein n=1 Tax=Panicum miliaceum TaxID=4540 RepID=A0A3L6TDS1_PANMI|nr:uncharacterized protein C2845_PM03G09240 [Panicum miliaceum]